MIELSTLHGIEGYVSFGLATAMLVGGMMMIISPFFYTRSDLNRIAFVTLFFWFGQVGTLEYRATLDPAVDSILCMISSTFAMFLVGLKPHTERQGIAASVFLAMIFWHFCRTFAPPSEYVTVINYVVNSMLWYALPLIVIFGGLWDAGIYYRDGRGYMRHPYMDDTVER